MLEAFGKRQEQPRDMLLLVTGQVAELLPVAEMTAEYVRAGAAELPRDKLKELVRPQGGRLFVADVDLPARVQAEDVRRLRRNAILGSLFHSHGGPDMNRVPWQVWVLIGVLVVFLGIAASR